MPQKRYLVFNIPALVAFMIFVLPVYAQGVLEEIIVTAQKREQNLQKIPTAVSAITAADMENKFMINLQDMKNVVPNLYMEEALGGTTTPKLFMRGVGVDNQVFSFDTPIGIYVDGVYFARVTGALVDLFDVERIEVLRGPQSVLFGRNNSAGSIRVVTKDPVLDGFEAMVDASIGSRDQLNARGTVSMPIVKDKLGIRISASTRNNDGYMRDLTTGQRFKTDEITAVRGSILFQPNADWQVLIRGDYMKDGSEPNQGSNFLVNPDNDIYTFETSPGAPLVNEVIPKGGSLTIKGRWGDIDVTSITAYRELKYRNAADVDGLAAVSSFEVPQQDLNEDQFTQEVFFSGDKLGSLDIDWVAGAFYFTEDNEFFWALKIFAPPPTQVFNQETETVAGYVYGTYAVTDRLRLSGGTRYTDESKKMNAIQFLADGSLNTTFNFNDEITANEWTWEAAADFDFSDNFLLYARGGTGFRSGGFNGSARDVASILSGSFDIEEAISAEGGFKSDLFDRRLRLNAGYYWVEYTGLQQAITQSDGTITTSNAAATVHGVEIEMTALPFEGMEITGTLGTMFDNIKNSDKEIKDTPEFSARLGAIYVFPLNLGFGGTVRIGADVSYRTDSFNNTDNAPFTNTGKYETVNANISYESEDGHWGLSLAGFNLTDQFVNLHTFNIAGGFISSVHYPNTPRHWLLTARYKF